MSGFAAARRVIAILLLALWWGGFSFYAGRVVFIGHEVLRSKIRQGFITERVTTELNWFGVAALAIVGWELLASERGTRRRAAWTAWAVTVLATIALFILHTKLAGTAHLEAAAKDYEKILARMDAADGPGESVIGNLAETYMMVGRIEESIETYKRALRGAADTSTWYGFAVALDRDERSDQALEVIASLGRDQRDTFHARVIRGDTFFVPEGEKFYYFALVDEALGLEDDAITYWRQYIASGAHPQYQPRARAHLDALVRKKRVRTLPIELPWRGILR